MPSLNSRVTKLEAIWPHTDAPEADVDMEQVLAELALWEISQLVRLGERPEDLATPELRTAARIRQIDRIAQL